MHSDVAGASEVKVTTQPLFLRCSLRKKVMLKGKDRMARVRIQETQDMVLKYIFPLRERPQDLSTMR